MTVDSGYPKSKSPQSPNKLVIIFTALEIKINGAKTSPSVFESGIVESQESGVRSRESRVESWEGSNVPTSQSLVLLALKSLSFLEDSTEFYSSQHEMESERKQSTPESLLITSGNIDSDWCPAVFFRNCAWITGNVSPKKQQLHWSWIWLRLDTAGLLQPIQYTYFFPTFDQISGRSKLQVR